MGRDRRSRAVKRARWNSRGRSVWASRIFAKSHRVMDPERYLSFTSRMKICSERSESFRQTVRIRISWERRCTCGALTDYGDLPSETVVNKIPVLTTTDRAGPQTSVYETCSALPQAQTQWLKLAKMRLLKAAKKCNLETVRTRVLPSLLWLR